MNFRAIYPVLTASLLAIAAPVSYAQNSVSPTNMSRGLLSSQDLNRPTSASAHRAATTVSSSAPVTNYAGNGFDAGSGFGGFAGDGGGATKAELDLPSSGYGFASNAGLAFDSAGNLYFADSSNNRIRKVAAGSGVITTVAGGGTIQIDGVTAPACSFVCGDSGPATSAVLYLPGSVTVDASGNLFIADTLNSLIRRVDASTGIITTVAGSYTCISSSCIGNLGYQGDGGAANKAELNRPLGVAVDAAGNIYIADTGNAVIRKVAADTGIITTFAGNGTGCAGQKDTAGDGCPGADASFGGPQDLAFDASGNLYISDVTNVSISQSFSAVRVVNMQTGVITIFAGGTSPICSKATDNQGDGCPATQAIIAAPTGIAFDSTGNLYIGDPYDNTIREVDTSGTINQVAGVFQTQGFNGSTASTVEFDYPGDIAFDANGNLYLSDVYNNVIQKVGFGSSAALIATKAILTSDSNPQSQGVRVTFTADVEPSSGTGVPTGSVSFTVDGGAGTAVVLDDTGHANYSTSTLTAGKHTIAASYAGSSSYAASQASLSETIYGTAASITAVSGSSQTATYGSAFTNPLAVLVKDTNGNSVPDAVVTFSGSGLTFSGNTATTDASGEASVTATAAAAGSLVATASVSGVSGGATFNLTAARAALTVAANSISVPSGQAIPALTYTAKGFVHGDTQSVLTGAPSETTTATQNSAAGTYPIDISQGTLAAANYSFQFVNGTLTVTSLGAAAAPAISPKAGTYTSAQTITITDTTPGAKIYYTKDGSTPTGSSTLYTAALTISATTTIKAIAVVSGYADSGVATATYTITLPATDFSLSLSPASLTLTAGNSGTTAVTVTPLNGFNAAISFTCSGQPAGATCIFSPATVTPSSTAATSTLTIASSATSSSLAPQQKFVWPAESLATALFLVGLRRKRRLLQSLALIFACVLAMSSLGGCGSSKPSTSGEGGTKTSIVTVTAASGILTHTATLNLTVN